MAASDDDHRLGGRDRVWIGWAVAFLIPLVLQLIVLGRDLAAPAAAAPRPDGRGAWGMWSASLVFLLGALILAGLFGGDGEVVVC